MYKRQAQGHAGFDPANPQGVLETRIDWPPAQEWEQALLASRWVSTPTSQEEPASTDAPLAYEEGLLYLRRYREYERRLAAGLQRLVAASPAPVDLAQLSPPVSYTHLDVYKRQA